LAQQHRHVDSPIIHLLDGAGDDSGRGRGLEALDRAPMITLHVNGTPRAVDDDPQTPLLYVLRGTLQLNAAKYGCGLAQCGSCVVLIDGEAVPSCVMPIAALEGKKITTLEGLGAGPASSALQRAFIAEQAAQCGYCTAGMIVRAHALLTRNPAPSDAQIREHMEPNLCRCGVHLRVLRAVRRASDELQKSRSPGESGAQP
jgi:nicotinate dehydrogenase subunit A